MSRLGGMSLIVGAAAGMFSTCLICFPALSARYLKAFPRSRFAGAALACAALSWSTILLMKMNLGFLEKYKPLLMVIAPIILVLIIFLVDELLAPRALGGLFLLIPAPILAAARWHESPWSLFATISAYIMIVKGVSLILNPYLFRKGCAMIMKTDAGMRFWGGVGLAYSAVWIVLAFVAY